MSKLCDEQKMKAMPIIRVGAVIIKNNSLLVVKSHYGDEQVTIVPGGGLEMGETLFECAKREAAEETGLDVKPEKLIYIREFIRPEKQNHNLDMFVLCSILGGSLKTGTDPDKTSQVIKEVLFAPLSNLEHVGFFPKKLPELLRTDLKENFAKCPKYLERLE